MNKAEQYAMDNCLSCNDRGTYYPCICSKLEAAYNKGVANAPLAEPVEGRWLKATDHIPIHLGHWNFPGVLKDINFPVRFKKQGKWYYSMGEIYNQGTDEIPKWSIYFNGDHHFENQFSEIEWRENGDESSTPSAREAETPAQIEQSAEKEANEQIVSLQAKMMFDEKESELLFEHLKDCYLSAALTKWIPIGRVKGTMDKEVRCALLPLYSKPGGYISAFWDEKNQEWIDGMKYVIDSGAYILDHNNEYETKELQRLWGREAELERECERLRKAIKDCVGWFADHAEYEMASSLEPLVSDLY